MIVPTYNCAHYLPDCLESLLFQTMSDFEIIVVDDASSDDTKRVIDKYLIKFADRLKYLKNKNNVGRGEVRNYGIRAAKGEYITFLDADDVYLGDKLSVQAKYLDEHTAFGGVSCQFYNGNEKLEPQYIGKGLPAYFEGILGNQYQNLETATPALMLRRRIFEKIGLFDGKIMRGQDTDLIIRICREFRIGVISKPLYIYRRHEKNTGSFAVLMERTESNFRMCKKIIDSEPQERKGRARKFAFHHLSSHVYKIHEQEHGTAVKVWFYYFRKMNLDLPLLSWAIIGIKVIVGYRVSSRIKRIIGFAAY